MGTWPACLTCRYEGSKVSEQLRVVSTFLFNVVPQLTATWVSPEARVTDTLYTGRYLSQPVEVDITHPVWGMGQSRGMPYGPYN